MPRQQMTLLLLLPSNFLAGSYNGKGMPRVPGMPFLGSFRPVKPEKGCTYMSLIIYLTGSAFVIGGIAWALVSAGVRTHYVMITSIILVGVAILTGVTRTRT